MFAHARDMHHRTSRGDCARRGWSGVELRDKDVVAAFRLKLSELLGEDRFELWFKDQTQIDWQDKILRVEAQSPFICQWLRANFATEIEAACVHVFGAPQRVVFRTAEPILAEALPPDAEDRRTASLPGPEVDDSTLSNRKECGRSSSFCRCLEDIVVGESNRLAVTSIRMASEKWGGGSPFLVHGPTGLGKTHLLQALQAAVREKHAGLRALYLSAEQFTDHFLEALRGSGLPSFRRKHRGTDLLLLDNLEFLSRKTATLEELAQTVEDLHRRGKQVAFASSVAPEQLEGISPEFLARLRGGLFCELQPPEFAMRREIARRMAARRSLEIEGDVLDYVAANFTRHAREISGALFRLQAASLAKQQPITLSLAERVLADLVNSASREVELPEIERAVCKVFGLSRQSLQSNCKSRAVSHPRMLAMWLARKYTRAALSEIGDYFGKRSHSTVISAEKKVGDWMDHGKSMNCGSKSRQIRDAVQEIEQALQIG